MDAVHTGDRPVVQGENHVPFSQTGPVGRPSRRHLRHHHSPVLLKAQLARQQRVQGNRLYPQPKIGATDPSFLDQLPGYPGGRINGYGKPNALGAGNNRSVDPDHPAPGIHQRAAAAARVEDSIGPE
jgi:hypothetical protein